MHPAVLGAFVLDILMFPVWWYSQGLLLVLNNSAGTIRGYAKYFAITVWLKNLFVPMYGTRDWQSRLISVFMRLVVIVGRLTALLVITCVTAGVLMMYIAAPITLAILVVYHLFGGLLYAA